MFPSRPSFLIWQYLWLIGLMTAGWGAAGAATGIDKIGKVFDGPAAEYVSAPPVTSASSEVIRWVWVQERMGLARNGAAVRVPLFFAQGECRDPGELVLVRWPSRERIPVQLDDVRRNADGGIARLHLWFATDVAAGESQRWALLRSGRANAKDAPAIDAKVTGGKLWVSSAGTNIAFNLDLTKRGPVASLQLDHGPVLKFADGAGATIALRDAAGTDDSIVPGAGGALEWGSGPIFAKIVVRARGKTTASTVEQVFRVFSDGNVNLCQTLRPAGPEENMTVKSQSFLTGRLDDDNGLSVHPQPAGIVESLRDFHRGYSVDELWASGASRGWVLVPGALGGTAGRAEISRDGEFRLQGPGAMTSGTGDARSRTVRAFWSEVSLYPAPREGQGLARAPLLAAAQPLVAVVDWPNLDATAAMKRIEDNVREMKPVGWVNETVIRHLNGRAAPFPKRNWTSESTPAHWVEAAQRASAKVTDNGTHRLAEDEKGRAAGPLDPYHVTYGTTALAFWLMRDELPQAPLASLRAELAAVRTQLGRSDEQGWPYLDVFARTQNMQMGPPFLALADRGADSDLRRFYRDQLAAPQLAAVMLRGLRPYEGRPQTGSVPSDELYQGVVDFFLRASELVLNETLGFQPVAFGRFLDAVDVNADLYHPAHARATELGDGFAHANFFRTQSHLHRWLNWGPAPFIALLQKPQEDGLVPGATEVWFYADALSGHWKNWPDQSWLFLAAELPSRAAIYSPSPRPAPVAEVHLRRDAHGNHVKWEKVPQASSYRIYRMREGHPPRWLNSPYAGRSRTNADALEWDDPEGDPADRYRVHVVDSGGRESGW